MVDNAELYTAVGSFGGFDDDLTMLRGELDRIHGDVDEDAPCLFFVSKNIAQVRANVFDQGDVFCSRLVYPFMESES